MSAQSREQFTQVVRGSDPAAVRLDLAALLLAAETLPTDAATGPALAGHLATGLGTLDELAAQVPPAGRDDTRLRAVLGGFHGEASDYDRLESSLLPAVLERRRGLPILLSLTWTEVARRVGIIAYGVGLPGHFVVGVGDPAGARVLVDPFSGGGLLPYDRARRLVAASGHTLRPEHLSPHDPIDTLHRVLANVRAWASRQPDRARTRLWACELALLLPRHDLELRRAYAEALEAVGRYAEAADQWDEYADLVAAPMPLSAARARTAAHQSRARLN